MSYTCVKCEKKFKSQAGLDYHTDHKVCEKQDKTRGVSKNQTKQTKTKQTKTKQTKAKQQKREEDVEDLDINDISMIYNQMLALKTENELLKEKIMRMENEMNDQIMIVYDGERLRVIKVPKIVQDYDENYDPSFGENYPGNYQDNCQDYQDHGLGEGYEEDENGYIAPTERLTDDGRIIHVKTGKEIKTDPIKPRAAKTKATKATKATKTTKAGKTTKAIKGKNAKTKSKTKKVAPKKTGKKVGAKNTRVTKKK